MPGLFDDLIAEAQTPAPDGGGGGSGLFDDLIEEARQQKRASLLQEKIQLGMTAEPSVATETVKDFGTRLGEIVKGFSQVVPSTLRTVAAGGDFLNRRVLNPLGTTPVPLEQLGTWKAAKSVEDSLNRVLPGVDPNQEVRDASYDFPRVVGQVLSMMAGGAALKGVGVGVGGAALGGSALGFGQEFDDAFQQARERGDSPDKAFAKSLGYATVATAIENKWGAGRLLKKYLPDAETAAKKLTALGLSKEIVKNFIAGGSEEGTQRFAENLIVDEKPSLEGVGTEAVLGGVAQGLIGLPAAGKTAVRAHINYINAQDESQKRAAQSKAVERAAFPLFDYTRLLGRTWQQNGETATILDVDDKGVEILVPSLGKSYRTWADIESTPEDVFRRTQPPVRAKTAEDKRSKAISDAVRSSIMALPDEDRAHMLDVLDRYLKGQTLAPGEQEAVNKLSAQVATTVPKIMATTEKEGDQNGQEKGRKEVLSKPVTENESQAAPLIPGPPTVPTPTSTSPATLPTTTPPTSAAPEVNNLEAIATETNASIASRTAIGEQRDTAMQKRRDAAVSIASTVQDGDAIVMDDGTEIILETPNKRQKSTGLAVVKGTGSEIDVAAEIQAGSKIRKASPTPAPAATPPVAAPAATVTTTNTGRIQIDVPRPDLAETDTPITQAEFSKYPAQTHAAMHAGTNLDTGEPLYWVVRKVSSLKSANPPSSPAPVAPPPAPPAPKSNPLSPRKPKPAPPVVPTEPPAMDIISKGDWIEYVDDYGKTHQGKVDQVWTTAAIVPTRAGVQTRKIRHEFSIVDASGKAMVSPKQDTPVKKIAAQSAPVVEASKLPIDEQLRRAGIKPSTVERHVRASTPKEIAEGKQEFRGFASTTHGGFLSVDFSADTERAALQGAISEIIRKRQPAPVAPTTTAPAPTTTAPARTEAQIESEIERVDARIQVIGETLRDIKEGNIQAADTFIGKIRNEEQALRIQKKGLQAELTKARNPQPTGDLLDQLKSKLREQEKSGAVDDRLLQQIRQLEQQAEKPETKPTAPVTTPTATTQTPETKPETKPSSITDTLSTEKQARLKELQARLREKFKQVGTNVDPEIITIGAEMGGLYIEAGARKFHAFAKQIKADLPDIWDNLKAHLKAMWEAAAVKNPDIDEPNRADVAKILAEIDGEAAKEEVKPEAKNEDRPDIRPEDQSGKPPAYRGGAPSGAAENAGNREDVGVGLPPAGKGADSGGDTLRPGERPERPGADAGAQPSGGILGGPAAGGTGASTTQPGNGAGVSEPAHNNLGRQNYFLSDPESIVGGGPKARFSKNQEAIETYHTLLAEQRDPTAHELDKLVAYTGWGSFGQELFNGSWESPRPKAGWEVEDAWLRDQLGEQGWKSAQQSIINAHYTDPVTVTSMWDMVRKMGFTGGRVLEPSVGIGNFFSLMPRDLMAASTLTGIELDQMTGRIAQMLHPQANIQIKGYQDSKTADNFYDLVIGNWPFADIKPADRRYNHLNANLHDYFFIKALDQVRPGGLVIGITSAGSMDKKNPTIRRYMASRAELVASFRLPAGTFGKYAGTKVVTDIIILRKRETPISDPKDNWIESKEKETKAGKFSYNQYYWDNPENILGTIGFGHGTTSGRPGMIVAPPANYEQAIRDLSNRVPKDVFQPWTQAKKAAVTIANTDSSSRQLSIVERNGELYQVQGEQLVVADELKGWKRKSAKDNKARLEEARAAIRIRTSLDALMNAYREGSDTESVRIALKKAYTDFVSKHGNVRDSFMLRYMQNLQDSSAMSVLNLEDDNRNPREVLDRDVLRRKPSAVSAGSIDDAFALQRNNSLHFSIDEVAKLSKTTPEEVRKRLIELDQIYQSPDGEWMARDEYLSGNVRRKLREALAAKESGLDMDRNIKALEAVMPRDIPHFDIEVRMGANWVTVQDYKDFVTSLIPARTEDVVIERNASGWSVKINNDAAVRSNEATVIWGHTRAKISEIIQSAMDGTHIRIYDEDPKLGPQFNEKATEEVNGKIEAVREQFQRWIWEDGERTARLTAEYNEVANSLVTPQRDGSYLRLEGLALRIGTTEFEFRKHQRDAVARFIQDGKGMGAHEVGTGKTYTMAGLSMEGRRLGVFRKPLLFAHNANSSSVRSDFQAAYPSGKFLYLDSLTPQERQSRLRQIALDDWDAIIVPHSLINRFTLSEATMMEMAKDEIQALEDEIEAAMDEIGAKFDRSILNDPKAFNKAVSFVPGAHTAKKLVKQRLRIIERIQKKAQDASKEDAVLFEDLGIDAIIVDEAHIFKKISLATRKQIKGLSKEESGAGFSLSLLTDYIKKQNNGKGVFLFTGTPVTNTLNEVYNMMRFVMSSDMTEAGIQRFDDWFNMFADSESEVEMTEAGTYEAVDRLRAFINVNELARIAGRYFDVVFAKTMPEFKDRTSSDGMTENPIGRPFKKVSPVTTEMSPEQLEHMASIRRRFSIWKRAGGKERRAMMLEGKDTPLQLSTESSLAALDFRLVDKNAPDYKGSKANMAVTKILDVYLESPETTQMVFMEQGYNDFVDRLKTVKDENGNPRMDADGNKVMEKERVEKFNLARDMVQKLMDGGVKPEEIAIFANMKLNPARDNPNDPLRLVNRVTNAVTKEDLAAMMRSGKIRIAFGQTTTMGTGVNAQTQMRAMHHLDAPWQPGEFEQRNGRGWRQGNKWNTVLEHRYFAEGSGDGKRWQFLLNKVRFITRFMEALSKTGNENLRTLEGEGADASGENDTVSDFEQSFGLAAGDPRQMLKAQLLKKIRKLEIKRDNHASGTYRARETVKRIIDQKPDVERLIAKRDQDTAAFNELVGAPFKIEIEGKVYTERAAADEAFKRLPVQIQLTKVGSWGAFTIKALRDGFELVGPSGNSYSTSQTVGSISAHLRNIAHHTDTIRDNLKRDLDSIPKLQEMYRRPFTDKEKLDNARMALQQIEAEIELSPFPAPSWLRNSVPMGSAIYLKQDGKLASVDVAAHRWDANNWWVLYEDGSGQMRPVPYTEVLDEMGNPMLETRAFVKPPTLDDGKAKPTPDAATPNAATLQTLQKPSDFLLDVPKAPKSLAAQRNQIRRILDNMEKLERESKEWSAPTIRYSRELHAALTEKLRGIEKSLLKQPPEAKLSLNRPVGKIDSPYWQRYGVTPDEQSSNLVQQLGEYLARQYSNPDYARGGVQVAELDGLQGVSEFERSGIASVERAFGKKIIFFKDLLNSEAIAGAAIPSDPNVIFLNESTGPRAPMVVAWHELLHNLRASRPDLYAELDAGLRPLIQEWAKFRALAEKNGYSGTDNIIEELYADFLGDQSTEPTFWEKIAANSPSKFGEIARTMLDFFKRLANWLRGNGFESSQYFTDIEKAQDVLAKVVAKYADEGGTQTGMEGVTPSFIAQQPLYSRLTRTVEQSQQGKATGAQWKATIKNSKLGANLDEMAMVGVKDLEDGKVYTKAEVLEYLKVNAVVVKDVTLGGTTLTDAEYKERNSIRSKLEHPPYDWPDEARSQARKRLDELDKIQNPTPFSTYQLPGAKEGSYREVLLTVPREDRYVIDTHQGEPGMSEPPFYVIRNLVTGKQSEPFGTMGMAKDFLDRVGKGTTQWHDGHEQYSDVANPIVRLRFNERTTADGKRMLFLEEVQAPQKGQFEKMPALFQKNWREIAFKWALRHAAENGFDSVGWTTGEQQAARYDLSKQIKQVRLVEGKLSFNKGNPRLIAYNHNGDVVIDRNVAPEKIEDYVGKEIAKKLAESTPVMESKTSTTKELSGLDLHVGGEGLKKLYDSDFRNVVNNLPAVKKSGQKVGTAEINKPGGIGQWRFDGPLLLPEEVRAIARKQDVRVEQQLNDIARSVSNGAALHDAVEKLGSEAAASALGGTLVPVDKLEPIHSIDMTPAIRASVMGGQAMFSLNHIGNSQDYRWVTGSGRLMRPQDAAFNAQVYAIENTAAVGHIENEFKALPADVKAQLPNIQGRISVIKRAVKDAGLTARPTGTLRQMAENASPDPIEQGQVAWSGAVNLINMVEEEREMFRDLVREHDDLGKLIDSEAQKESRERTIDAAAALIGFRRGKLTAARDEALARNDLNGVDLANKSLNWWVDREEAVANVLQTMVGELGVPFVTSHTAQEIVDEFKLRNPAVGAAQDVVDAVLTSGPQLDLPKLLEGIGNPKATPAVIAALKRYDIRTQAHTFLKEAIAAPEFQTNYKEAVDLTGSRAIVTRQNTEGEMVYANPINPDQSVTVRHGFDEATYKANVEALMQARDWFHDYLQQPNADPLVAAGVRFQLEMIDRVHLSQQFDPKTGKNMAGGFNPFDAAIRGLPGVMDVPEYSTSLAGGRESAMAGRALQNYANVRQAVMDAHHANRVKTTKATMAAAKSAGLTVPEWQDQIGNKILGSYQNRGDRRYRLNDSVGGHVITAEDLAAVRAQKSYTDAITEQVKRLAIITETGRQDPILTRDRIGRTSFERRAQATSEFTVPQRAKKSAQLFVDAWNRISEDQALSKDEKQTQHEALLEDNFLDAVVGHVESFTNPTYAQDIDSPFKSIYHSLTQDNDSKGLTFHSLDELADAIFAAQQSNLGTNQMSHDEIREQIVKEIGHTVNLWSKDEKDGETLFNPDKSTVAIVSAENFLNRPRGKRILPAGFYTYTTGLDEEQNGILYAVLAIPAQRYVNALEALRSALQTEVVAFDSDIKKGLATEKTIREQQQAGERFLNYNEAKEVLTLVNRQITHFTAVIQSSQGQEHEIYKTFGRATSTVANGVLQRIGTMLGNYAGAIFQRVRMEQVLLGSAQNIFMRTPFLGTTARTVASIARAGKATVDAAMGLMAGLSSISPRIDAMQAAIRANPSYYNSIGGMFANYLAGQRERITNMKRLGIIEDDQTLQNLDAYWSMFKTGGKLTERKPSLLGRANNLLTSSLAFFNETGFLIQLPRALGSQAIDKFNNAQSSGFTYRFLNELVRMSSRIMSKVDVSKLNPQSDRLSPQEILGHAKASARDVAELRQMFDKAGTSLDRVLIEYWQARQAGVQSPVMMTEPQVNSLMIEVAKVLNKGMFSNRPQYASNLARFGGLFFGYGINQNAQLARNFAKFSQEQDNAWKDSARVAADVSSLIFLVALFGQLGAFPLYYLLKWIYKEDRPVKPLSEANSIGDVVRTLAQNGLQFAPLIGRSVLNALSPTAQGFSLVPISMLTSVWATVSRASQTGAWDRAVVEFLRQWAPNSRVILNRLGMREGATNESALRAALIQHAPAGVDVKATGPNRQTVYSPASGYVDRVINALSRTAGPDMEAVRRARSDGIKALVAAGKTEEEASKSFDRSVLARNPYISTYGRELTDSEMADVRAHMTPDQLENQARVEGGRKAYAAEFGLSEPDYIRGDRGTGGGVGVKTPSAPRAAAAGGSRAGGGAAVEGLRSAGGAGGAGGASIAGGRAVAPATRGLSRGLRRGRRPSGGGIAGTRRLGRSFGVRSGSSRLRRPGVRLRRGARVGIRRLAGGRRGLRRVRMRV